LEIVERALDKEGLLPDHLDVEALKSSFQTSTKPTGTAGTKPAAIQTPKRAPKP